MLVLELLHQLTKAYDALNAPNEVTIELSEDSAKELGEVLVVNYPTAKMKAEPMRHVITTLQIDGYTMHFVGVKTISLTNGK